MKNKFIALGLIMLGSIQMIGDLANIPILKGIGQATNASPAPKVFTSQKGYETFSKRFFFEVTDKQGERQIIEITPHNYQHLKGPYNRRNMYGATISYAPVLVKNEKTASLFYSVAQYGLCNPNQTILEEMGIEYDKTKPVTLKMQARHPTIDADFYWKNEFTFDCEAQTYA